MIKHGLPPFLFRFLTVLEETQEPDIDRYVPAKIPIHSSTSRKLQYSAKRLQRENMSLLCDVTN